MQELEKKKHDDEAKYRPLSGKWQSRNHILESIEDHSSRGSPLNGGRRHRLSGIIEIKVVVVVVLVVVVVVVVVVVKSILDSEDLTEIERKKIEICQELGASNWLTALPLREAGFNLNK